MKRKALALLTAAAVGLAALPSGFAGAVQGTLEVVKPDPNVLTQVTGYANPGPDGTFGNVDDPGSNIVKFKVTDGDLNVNNQLPSTAYTVAGNRFEIIQTADGTNSFTVTNSPIGDKSGDGLVNFNDVQVLNLQNNTTFTPNTVSSTTVTTVSNIAAGTILKFDPTIVPSSDTGYLIGTATGTNVVQVTAPTQLQLSGDITIAGAGTNTVDIYLNVTRIIPATGVTSDITVRVAGVGADFTNQYLNVDYTTGLGTPASPHPATLAGAPLAASSANALFISAFRDATAAAPMPANGAVVLDFADADDTFDITVNETHTVGVSYVFSTENDTDNGAGTIASPYSQSVRVTSTSNTTGLNLTLFETDTSTEATSKTTGVFQRIVANWPDWKSHKSVANSVVTTKGLALVDGTLRQQIENNRKVAGTPATHTFLGSDVTGSSAATAATTTTGAQSTGPIALGAAGDLLREKTGQENGALDLNDFTFTVSGLAAGETLTVTGVTVVQGDGSTTAPTITVQHTNSTNLAGTPTITVGFTYTHSLSRVLSALNTHVPGVDDDNDGTVDEAGEPGFTDGANWVVSSIQTLGLSQATNVWEELMNVTLTVAHNDIVTILYTDANGVAVTRTLTVDLSAPTITGVTPAKGSAVTTTTPQLRATVKDLGSGLSLTNLGTSNAGTAIRVFLDPGSADPTTARTFAPAIITDGFDIIALPAAPLAAGSTVDDPLGQHTWKIVAEDKVGNRTQSGLQTFAVDNVSPSVSAAKTGVGLKLMPGSTDTYYEVSDSSGIRLTMSEKVDPASLATSDFDVEGSSPPATVMAVKKIDADGLGAGTTLVDTGDARKFVYLTTTSPIDPAAKPKVTVVGVVGDVAGNSAPTGAASGASSTPTDGIAPTLTVALDKTLGKNADKITVTVTANEALVGDVPTIKTGATCAAGVALSVTKTGTNAWTAQHTIGAVSQALVACADGTDGAGNAATQKTATFEADVAAPGLLFQDATATDVFAPSPANRDVDATVAGLQVEIDDVLFIPVSAIESAEYAGDTHTKVAVVSASLDTLSKLTPAGGTVDIVSTETLEVSQFQTTNNVNHVVGLADLPIGFYRINVKAKDDAGNEMAANASQEFAVVAQKPVSVAVNPGWTLVSIPGRPQDRAIDTVLADTSITQVWSFNNATGVWEFARKNAETGAWEGTLTQIADGRSYYVRSSTFDPIKVLLQRFSPQRTPPQYALKKGWNGIGYTPGGAETSTTVFAYTNSLGTGIDPGWGVIRWWNPVLQRYESAWPNGTFTAGFPTVLGVPSVMAGQGYLIYATRDAVLAP